MLQVQQECEDAGVSIELTKFGSEDGPSAYFVARMDELELKMNLHAPHEWLGSPVANLGVLAIDWDGTNDYDVDGSGVFEPMTAGAVVNGIKAAIESLSE